MQPQNLPDLGVAADKFLASMTGAFRPFHHYSKGEDILRVFTADAPTLMRPLNKHVTILESRVDGSFCGFILNGLSALIGKSGLRGPVTVKMVVEKAVQNEVESYWSLDSKSLRRVRDQELCLQ